MVLRFNAGGLWLVEIKLGTTQAVSSGFYRAQEVLQAEAAFVIQGGPETIKLGKGGKIDGYCLIDAARLVAEQNLE
ncbi:hypothetical protein [Kordiimonas aestuarii]|uniref:hypothetical protein n=1 Tax=Kordiimonas aestuarii TaxID=1005925 RepID=UPI0021D0E16E|nr:hypothetical protein [Kordiimonas aestuarii]